MVIIDGSFGEGGGQILRTSLALSLVTGTPFRIDRIRAGRPRPGLMRQHLTAVKAAAEVGRAQVAGAAIGSARLDFIPGAVVPGEHRFAVGTAGSTMLVLQTVLPPLLRAAGPSSLVLEGGTHNTHAPPFDFVARTFLPLIGRLGPRVTATLERPGFYPAGGGRVRVEIEPAGDLRPFDLIERGPIRRRLVRGVVAGLPRHIAEREVWTVIKALDWEKADGVVEELPPECGPGNVVMIELESDALTEVVTGFGERGVRAEEVARFSACPSDAEEEVARRAADEVRRYLAADAPVGEHLADQWLIPLALAGGGAFLTGPLTDHATTNIEVMRRFLDVDAAVEEVSPSRCRVRIAPVQIGS